MAPWPACHLCFRSLIGEAPGQRPGGVFFPNVYNGEGCAADIAVTCLLHDVCARLADGMSPADHYAAAEKHSKYDVGFVGSGVTFCAVVLETFDGLA